VIWDLVQSFTEEAATRGFEHAIPLEDSTRNAYYLMRDYADWLEGALWIVAEQELQASPVDPVQVGEHTVLLDCWRERDDPSCGHTFRIVDRPTVELSSRWPEWLASLDETLETVTIHALVLPPPVKDRIPSPLVLAYSHPLTGQMRLATLETERGHVVFSEKWKRVARWETEASGLVSGAIHWPEWREGIERDCCLDRCYREGVVEVGGGGTGGGGRDRQLFLDAVAIARDIQGGNSPRKREACRRCYMNDHCNRCNSTPTPSTLSPALVHLTFPAAARK
jgi:hypothetical protein